MTITVYPPPGATNDNPIYTSFSDGEIDAFGRLRVSNPYTLFDSQQRYASDTSFDYATATGGTAVYQTNKAATLLSVTTSSGSSASAQSLRSFPYQPGKSLLILATFSMSAGQTGTTQRVGYFNTQNGIFFEQTDGTVYMVVRTYTSGAVVENRVPQSAWNGDKLNGSGKSGITLDVTKTQIFYIDLEWLGVGIVRTGFVLNGNYVLCNTFYNANVQSYVYMTTAVLPVRYEISNTTSVASTAYLQQICSTVISEGGYQQTSQQYWARMTGTPSGNIPVTNVFVPLVSIRLNANKLGAVVLPEQIIALPLSSANYEVALVRNVALTGASWVTGTFADVDYDVSATAFTSQPSATSIVQLGYVTAVSQSTSAQFPPFNYQWDLQLGVTQAGVSDVLTLCARSIGATGSANSMIAGLGFYDLTL